jgi:hypothetical protein
MNATVRPELRTRDVLVIAALVLLVSAAAFAATAHNCSTTDGSFSIGDRAARPTVYCRATDLYPPALDGGRGVAVCALLFAGPLLTVLGAMAVSAWRRRPPPARLLLAALIASGFTLLFSLFGGVGYEPYV